MNLFILLLRSDYGLIRPLLLWVAASLLLSAVARAAPVQTSVSSSVETNLAGLDEAEHGASLGLSVSPSSTGRRAGPLG